MIKIDLHMHSGEDPEDGLPYPATALIDKAVELGYAAIAITLHGRVLEDQRVFDYARDKGLLLIRAVEWKIQKRDVLLYNVSQRDVDQLKTFDDLRACRRDRGGELLVVAPHPFYIKPHCLGRDLERHIELFDAIEHAMAHVPWLNPNRAALRIAHQYNKPVIANSDAHGLWMFGRHYTLVDAEPTMPSIFRAIRENRLQWHSPPMWFSEFWRLFVTDALFARKRGRITESFP